MATHKKSLVREIQERLDSLMVIGQSRHEAKQRARAEQRYHWGWTDNKIHSYKTREVYQEHSMRFGQWVKATYGLKRLEDIEDCAEELACLYLLKQLGEGKSPYTLKTIRSALRMLFQDRSLANSLPLPERHQKNIKRSRHPVSQDAQFASERHENLINFLQSTGLRRSEIKALRVADIRDTEVFVKSGKGGKSRMVPILPGREKDVQLVARGRKPDGLVFTNIPSRLDVHALRREYAQTLYLSRLPAGSTLPGTGRLADYDKDAVLYTSRALGHNRYDVVLRHYLR